MEEEINKGLGKDSNPEASVKCFPTYVRDLPNGKGECGHLKPSTNVISWFSTLREALHFRYSTSLLKVIHVTPDVIISDRVTKPPIN